MKHFLPMLVILAALTHTVHRPFVATSLTTPLSLRETLPSAEALKLIGLSYRSLLADYYWLRALGEFGGRETAAQKYPNLEALTRRVLALDPYFVTAYFFAGTALTVKELDPSTSIELLKTGMQYRPDNWKVPFLLGFNLYYFAHDYAAAAEALTAAAKLDGCPPIAGPLATRLAAEAGTPEVGLKLVNWMLANTNDETLRKTYEERQHLLQLEVELRWLGRAVILFQEQQGHSPKTLEELVQQGQLTHLPKDPLGGSYGIDAQGHVTTTSEAKRLRVFTAPGDPSP